MTQARKKICKIIYVVLTVFILSSILLAYFYYIELKRNLISRISDRATSIIGQKVDIGDISFSATSGINLHDIIIENPEGFGPGKLLEIKRLRLNINFREIFRGKFYFKDISAYSPKLTLITDKDGRLNISYRPTPSHREKTRLKYHIDEFKIFSGRSDFNKDARYRNTNISLTLKNLSPNPGMKTFIKGKTSTSGGNRMMIDGWIYFNDRPKKFNISVLSEDFNPSSFREFFDRYNIDTKKTVLNLNLNAEGDTERGFDLRSGINIKSVNFDFFQKGEIDIHVGTDAFYNINDSSIIVNNISLDAGDISAVRLKGMIRDILKNPSYSADIKIDRLDLASIKFIKDLKVEGIVTSDDIRVYGESALAVPEISGSVKLIDANIKSTVVNADKINAYVKFSSDIEMSVRAEASAKILQAGAHMLNKPADIRLLINTHGKPEAMTLFSSVSIWPIDVNFNKDRNAYLDGINIDLDGTLKEGAFLGKSSIETKGLRYAHYNINRLNSNLDVYYSKDIITIKDLKIDSEDIKSNTGQIKIRRPGEKGRAVIEIQDLDAVYPEKKAELEKFDFNINLNIKDKLNSGDFTFSTNKIMFQDIASGMVTGKGSFDKKGFSVVIPRADVSSGSIRLTAKGKTSEGPFPLNISLTAEDIDLNFVSRAASTFFKIPFSISGNMKKAYFNGDLDSAGSVHGNASVEAEKISVLNIDAKQNILKNASLNTEVILTGKDFEFIADAGVGNISAKISGLVKEFLKIERSAEIKAVSPEIKVTAIRDSLWDIFPDKLLYVGMDGSISSDLSIDYGLNRLRVHGNVSLKDFILEGEYGEYSVGPINGIVPIAYGKAIAKQNGIKIPVFERSEFKNIEKYYSERTVENGYNRITIGSLSYGFRLLKNINIWINQKGSVLNIKRFSGNMFGGRLYGSAVFDIADGLNYRLGIFLKGLSMTKLCDDIEPIKGFITGKVDGTVNLKGSGTGISRLIGKADFWAYSANNEKTKISKKFLQNIGGPSLKTYLGDRRFNKGIMSLYLKNGFIIFKELEISNRSFIGITDLSVKVAPFNNRIEIDHLMWTMTEAAHRAKEKSLANE